MLVQITWAIILKNDLHVSLFHISSPLLSSPLKANRQILLLGLRSW